jgi:hypothetical protein
MDDAVSWVSNNTICCKMTKHARLSASSSAKWLNCPGSIKAEEPYPNVTSKFAEEGTKAHELAESLLRDNVDSSIHYDDDIDR